MATDAEKMIRLIRDRIAAGVPENAEARAEVKDESDRVRIRFGFTTYRDIIQEAGYEADDDTALDVAACLAALADKIEGMKVMEAALLSPADVEALVSDDGEVDEENKPAAALAYVVLAEALKGISNKRGEAHAAWLEAQRETGDGKAGGESEEDARPSDGTAR